MNTTALIEQWTMEEVRDLDIRALLLGENRSDQVEAALPPVWDGDGDPPVFFKDPREAGWQFLDGA
jgi:tRNA(Ile)-lysidine synthase TilS/MesJ